MIVLGLTGGIGMGKSTVARAFARMGVPVFDADAAVHTVQAKGGAAVPLIEAAFPGTTRDGATDRAALRPYVLGNPEALKRLEAIIHPLIDRMRRRFLWQARRRGCRMAMLDVPLLMEVGWDTYCDLVITVSAPREIQLHRVRLRGKMSEADIRRIIAAQAPDWLKRRRADVVIPTGLSRSLTQRSIRRLTSRLAA